MTHRGVVAAFIVVLVGCGPARSSGSDDTPIDAFTDHDGDGYSVEGGDCNDDDPAIHPDISETCGDSIDNNCNGMTDSNDYDCFTPCQKATADRSSVGCVYYAVDTNSIGGPWAVAVSNVDATQTANVVVEKKTGATWAPIAGGTLTVGPRGLKTVPLPRAFTTGSALMAGGAFRITSDLPVISYQFAPIDGSASFLSDASLLLPVSALDRYYVVSAWPTGLDQQGARRDSHIQIFASEPTNVTVTSPVATLGSGSAPALAPNVPHTYALAEGDYLQLTVAVNNESLTGTYIESDKPVGLFSSNDCANVPNVPANCCCDHLEEQIFGLQTWGKSYVGAQMPKVAQEGAVWQILAQQDATTVTFSPGPGVTGLPPTVTLGARQKMEFTVTGGTVPGDFVVTSDKPILVNQFTVGSFTIVPNGSTDDPDMVQAVPTEQYLAHYNILVPGTWINDFLVLIRKSGSTVMVDGVAPGTAWRPLAGGWETTVLPVPDGVHVLDGSAPFGVAVSGYDTFDSYSYPGGLGQTVINPIF